jgi:hypothetical protein
VAQLAVASSSVFIPKLLGWHEETKLLRPLTRQVFWTYSRYILGINTSFGLLALLAPHLLLDGSPRARLGCAFIAVYWTVRVTLQFAVYDRSVVTRPLFRFAEAAYVCAFVYSAVVYAMVAVVS